MPYCGRWHLELHDHDFAEHIYLSFDIILLCFPYYVLVHRRSCCTSRYGCFTVRFDLYASGLSVYSLGPAIFQVHLRVETLSLLLGVLAFLHKAMTFPPARCVFFVTLSFFYLFCAPVWHKLRRVGYETIASGYPMPSICRMKGST